MSEFHRLSAVVADRFTALSAGELYVVDLGDTDLFQFYLDSFPAGTNPIFRTRTEHDCSCCKQFIRNLGRVVAIEDGEVRTVWDDYATLPEPYATVSAALADFIAGRPIKSVYRTKERQYGNAFTMEQTNDGAHKWHHFVGRIADRHFAADPETKRSERDAVAQVLRRGLNELTSSSLNTILDLIDANSLYRGEEHLPALRGFRELQQRYEAAPNKELFIWQNLDDRSARFRNTVIGTLAVDLSDGVDLEPAVRSFETKVAPANYKRPTALITPKMIEQAVETLDGLGLSDAVNRRMARIEDVSVNNVLFVDNGVRGQMKDGNALTDLLMGAAKPAKAPKLDDATPISAEDFFGTIVPTATSIGLLIENSHLSNFVTLTAPQEAGPGRLFRWNNDFAWSYDGEVADSDIRAAVQALGGRVDGVLRFSHQWNYDKRNASLMDLHVFLPGSTPHTDGCHDRYPSGQRVGWNNRQDYASGGVQDVDYVQPAPAGYVPVENITFPSMAKLKDGEYTFAIHNWNLRQPTQGGFRCEIEFGGQVFSYEVTRPLKHKEWITVAVATLRNGVFTIEHKLPSSTSSQKKWGIDTMTIVPVDTAMASPNYWDGQGVGNRHWFFFLKGCRNPDEVRGIYNEFLRPELEQHRKVFEVLGSKTKCPSTADQLSGVGFSSTRGDSVVAVVNNGRAYRVQF